MDTVWLKFMADCCNKLLDCIVMSQFYSIHSYCTLASDQQDMNILLLYVVFTLYITCLSC